MEQVLLVIEALRDQIQDPQGHQVLRETKDLQVLWVFLVLQDQQDHQDNKDLRDRLDHLDLVDHQVLKVLLVVLDLWGHLALRVHPVLLDHQAHKGLQGLLVHQVQLVLLVMLVQLDSVDLQGLLVRLDLQETKGLKVFKEVLVLQVQLDQLVLLDLLVPLDQQVHLVMPVLLVLKVHWALRVVLKGLRDLQGFRDHLAHLVIKEIKVRREPVVPLELLVSKVHWDPMASLVPKGQLDLKGHLVTMVPAVLLANLEILDHLVVWDLLGQPAQVEIPVIRDPLADLVHPDSRVSLVLLDQVDHWVIKEHLVHLVGKVRLDLRALQERQECLDLKDHKVLKVQ